MDIAALSKGLSQANVQQQASTSVMKMTMNTAEDQANGMEKMLDSLGEGQSIKTHLGNNLDV